MTRPDEVVHLSPDWLSVDDLDVVLPATVSVVHDADEAFDFGGEGGNSTEGRLSGSRGNFAVDMRLEPIAREIPNKGD
jgi:hypothetical protein